MTLIEIRKWQIEKAFEAASKQADAQRQTAERLFLACVALAAATPVYLTLLRTSPLSYPAFTVWILLFAAFVGSIFTHINSFDMHREASESIGKRAAKLGLEDIEVDFGYASLPSFRNARRFLILTILVLGIGCAAAIGYAAYKTMKCIDAGEPTAPACAPDNGR